MSNTETTAELFSQRQQLGSTRRRRKITLHQRNMVSRNLGFRFTLISYNTLSQTLLRDHQYLYAKCDPKDLEWPRRGHRIISEILNNQADIICLQEVDSEHLQSLYRPKLDRRGYECLYKKRTGFKVDGCAIFFKRALFQLLNYKGVEFNRTDVTNILNRDNVGIIAVLRPKVRAQSESSQLVIANTHLLYNPARIDIRLAQLKLFLTELDQLSFERYDSRVDKRCHHPTILCGDLNSVPESDIYKFITEQSITVQRKLEDIERDRVAARSSETQQSPTDTERQIENEDNATNSSLKQTEDHQSTTTDLFIDQLSHPFQFESVYPSQNEGGQSYVSSTPDRFVDYIFYTPKLRLESYRELLTKQEMTDIVPLPNSNFPSDHLTLEARFTMV